MMTPDAFERLSRRVVDIAPRVTDEKRLFEAALYILKADDALLLERAQNNEYIVKSEHSLIKEYKAEGNDFAAWYSHMPREDSGYTSLFDTPLQMGQDLFSAAVVGFGREYDLLVLYRNKPFENLESYHAWAAASLVLAYENVVNAEKARYAAISKKIVEIYKDDFGTIVLEDTSWKTVETILPISLRDAKRSHCKWLYACEYLGYRSRFRWKTEEDKVPYEEIPEASTEKSRAEKDKDVPAYARKALEILRGDSLSFIPAIDELIAVPVKNKWIKEDSSTVPADLTENEEWEKWEEVSLIVLEHGWRLILKGASGFEHPPRFREDAKTVQEEREDLKDDNGGDRRRSLSALGPLTESAQALLKLSTRLLGIRLAMGWPEGKADGKKEAKKEISESESAALKSDNAEKTPGSDSVAPESAAAKKPSESGPEEADTFILGRNKLRAYFSFLLAHSKRLRQTFFKADPPNGADAVPEASRREFLLQLSRYFLGLVEGLQKLRGLDTTTSTVTPGEVLDSLLYLVDRYAHLQLEVDEWIDIRHHLARAVRSEVDLHLSNGRYRDHLLHVIDVFLLGHLLLHTRMRWTGPAHREEAMLVDQLTQFRRDAQKNDQGSEANTKSKPDVLSSRESLRNWATASLLHDIGYQLQWKKRDSLNVDLLHPFFDLSDLAPSSPFILSTTGDPKENIAALIERLREIKQLEKILPEAAFEDASKKLPRDILKDASKTLPKELPKDVSDHGVLSAVRLAQILASVGQKDPRCTGNKEGCLDDYIHALHAISFHNRFSHKVCFRRHPVSCLLRLCDELQEWERHRVDIEGMVKQLYLAIEGENSVTLNGKQLLSEMRVNLAVQLRAASDSESGKMEYDRIMFALNSRKDEEKNVEATKEERPHLRFTLVYQDPVTAQYDPTLTLLSKAYNFQHLDLEGPDTEEDRRLRWTVKMEFPHVDGYGRLCEYDIYARFAIDKARWLPRFLPGKNDAASGQGLLRSLPKPGRPDCFTIVVQGRANPEARKGWLMFDPASITDAFLKFKKDFLRSR